MIGDPEFLRMVDEEIRLIKREWWRLYVGMACLFFALIIMWLV
jgi:hypothetical protein